MDGAIVVDKPAGWTSHDVVGKLRRIAGTRRVGHLGTLDPMATGVLPVLLNRATRLSQFLMKADKVYDAEVRFGFSTSTYDAEGEPMGEVRDVTVEEAALRAALPSFVGEVSQIPPPVSAKKINGVPAYKLARKNQAVELRPVPVSVYSIKLLSCGAGRARLRVHCGPGTYIRRIAHDLGGMLGCGAHLSELRRTRSGSFDAAHARTIEQLGELAADGRLAEALLPAAELLPAFPAERVDTPTALQIRQGRDFRVSPFRVRSGSKYLRAVDEGGELVAIAEMVIPNLYHPMLVL